MLEADNDLKRKTARLSVISNTLLVIGKLLIGLYTGAVSIISEAAHSAVDLLAALIAWYAVRQAVKPPDAAHAYGHGKVENISGAVEALLIIGAAVLIIVEAIDKISQPVAPEFLELGMLIMVASIFINYWVSNQLMSVATKTGSHALEADALHLKADIWTSVGVLLGLGLIKVTGLPWIDPVVAILVAFIVFKAGYSMTKKSVYELTDVSLPEEEEKLICDIVSSQPEVIAGPQLRTRRSGSYRLIDMHVILYKDMQLAKAHEICDQIEAKIKERLGNCDVVIHLEPCDHHEEFGQCPLHNKD